MTKIELSTAEIQIASMVGIQRQIEDIKNKKQSFKGESQATAWQRHIEGSLAECALAKHFNVYWSKRPYPLPDVYEYEVRSTPYMSGVLPIIPEDKDDRKYFLLTGINGAYIIRGWIYGAEAKQQEWWRSLDGKRPPCYCVPQSALKSLNDEK